MELQSMMEKIKEEAKNHVKKAIIISGGTIDREFALSVLKRNEWTYIITADAGLTFLYEEQIEPTHIVGDFDSLEQKVLEEYMANPHVKIRMYSPIKDKTDTEIAIRLAMELESREIWILGGTGGRIDHTIGNLQTMMIPMKAGIECVMADDQNEIRLIDRPTVFLKSKMFGKYLSLLPFAGPVEGLTVSGVKYPLEDAHMDPSNSLGVSNEIVDETAKITLSRGVLLVIMSKDRS